MHRVGHVGHAAIRLLIVGCVLVTDHLAAAQPAAPPPAGPASAPAGGLAPKRIKSLEPTTDDIPVAAWLYPLPEGASPLATVLLVHDLKGSHQTVEPLAKALQSGGCTVVAVDLRGHGESKHPRATATEDDPAKLLRPDDYAMIAATAEGRMRDQAGVRGDIECVRAWIKRETDAGTIPRAPLVVVGSGLGGSLCAKWTIADAAWPDTTKGPQGGDVAGLVLVSPPLVTKGLRMQALLGVEPVATKVPVMVVAGQKDRDAAKVFDQLKRQRPGAWFDSRFPPGGDRNASPVPPTEASALMFTIPVEREGDALAATRTARGDAASLILSFARLTQTDEP